MFEKLKSLLESEDYKVRRIAVLAGVEEVARREKGIWYIKTAHCARCGECCKRVPPHWRHGLSEEGFCKFLKHDGQLYYCDLEFPFGCLTGDCAGEDYCSVTWEKVDGI